MRPNKPIAGLIVDAGEYLPCAARSKKSLSSLSIKSSNSFFESPLAILLTENDGELTYVTIAPSSIFTATTAPLLLSNLLNATF